MRKSELVDAIASKTGLSKKDSEAAIEAVTDVVTDALQKGDEVALTGFGTFKVTKRAARKGINPLTKQPLDIPASNAPKFKAGKALKEAVNK